MRRMAARICRIHRDVVHEYCKVDLEHSFFSFVKTCFEKSDLLSKIPSRFVLSCPSLLCFAILCCAVLCPRASLV